MAIRFQRSPLRGEARRARDANDGFGEWWAAMAIVALAAIAALSLGGKSIGPGGPLGYAGAAPGGNGNSPGAGSTASATEEISNSLLSAEEALAEIDRSLRALCQEPVLIALELAPDCKTGVMTIGDSFFDGSRGNQLNAIAKEDVRAAFASYLEALRRRPALWESLEAIEIRGHSDPRAFRNAYTTNLVGSQQRALGILYFLTSDAGLSKKDQGDLERLASVSGVSFSRPPASCPEAVRECYAQWRRVEIRPVLSESRRRQEWSRTVESVQILVQRATGSAQNENPDAN